MKDLKIFKTRTIISEDGGSTVLHIDDMKSYPTWMLTNDKMVDNVLYRGISKSFNPKNINISQESFENKLKVLGDPEYIMITFDKTFKNLQ